MPDFQTKPLTITIVSRNDFRIFPRNVMACGSLVSAVIANLVMEDIEHRALTTAPVSPSFWKRFVDDVISAVSQDEIVVLLQHLNSIEPSIQFTVERETDGKLPFLVLVFREQLMGS